PPASAAAAGSGAPAASAPSSSDAAPGASAAQLLDVTIGAPYTLTDLPASKADTIQAGIEKDLGPYGKAVHASVKEIQQGGTTAGYLMVVAFPNGTLTDNVYQQVITDLSMGAESDFTTKPVGAVPVSYGTLGGGSVAVFRQGDLVMIALSPTTTDLTPVVTALVKANG
ncbi:MAG TPA: hypothetical protein VIH37_00020, partial [Candidatus Limnocylindrales bacterium]